jgi:hypothetical protein
LILDAVDQFEAALLNNVNNNILSSTRFFFKTRCDDDDNPIIQEEMCNDSDVLPLFEGKVMATVKSAN